MKVEVLKCLGQTESPVLRPRWGIGCFYTDSHVQEKSRQGYRIRAITLFGLQGSYLFAWFDMFLLTRGVVLYGKPIVLKCIYLFCRQNSLTEQGWGEKEIVCQVFQRVRSLCFVPACCALSPVELWLVGRTCPPSACAAPWTKTWRWHLTDVEMSSVSLVFSSMHNHNQWPFKCSTGEDCHKIELLT